MMKFTLLSLILLTALSSYTQFAPAAGEVGSTAISKDSSAFINWASEVVEFSPGPEDLSNSQSPLASFGLASNALGQAEGNSFDVVSLGDGGSITLSFEYPITDADGPDFAVFENSFTNTYLEFAFVEVSTNGTNFVRFPAISNIPTIAQSDAFGLSDPTLVNNLAGKYRQGFGVPFDLNELVDSLAINIDSINFVRIVDVVGSIDSTFGSFDSNGNLINDPFPSPFNSSGFDLDGIGVIHQNNPLNIAETPITDFKVYPNPAGNSFELTGTNKAFSYLIYDLTGAVILRGNGEEKSVIYTEWLNSGSYVLQINTEGEVSSVKLIIQK